MAVTAPNGGPDTVPDQLVLGVPPTTLRTQISALVTTGVNTTLVPAG